MQESVTADRKETSAAWQGGSAVVESWREIYAARTKHTQERIEQKKEGQTAVAKLEKKQQTPLIMLGTEWGENNPTLFFSPPEK